MTPMGTPSRINGRNEHSAHAEALLTVSDVREIRNLISIARS